MNLYLDLDGVFANFNEAISFARSNLSLEHHDDPSKLWSVLQNVDNLFLNLKPIPQSIEAFNEVSNRSKYPVKILTALPMLKEKLITAPSDKRLWVSTHLSSNIEVICVSNWRKKRKYCIAPSDVLVDDMERNIKDWKSAGGIGVHHTDWNISLSKLKELDIIS